MSLTKRLSISDSPALMRLETHCPSDAPHEVLVQGDVLHAEEVGVDQADDQAIEDADVLDSDSDIPLLGLGLGETEPAEVAAPLGPEPASLLPGALPGEPEPVEEVALLENRR